MNKPKGKPKKQSRIDNPEVQAILSTRYRTKRKKNKKQQQHDTTQHNTGN